MTCVVGMGSTESRCLVGRSVQEGLGCPDLQAGHRDRMVPSRRADQPGPSGLGCRDFPGVQDRHVRLLVLARLEVYIDAYTCCCNFQHTWSALAAPRSVLARIAWGARLAVIARTA